ISGYEIPDLAGIEYKPPMWYATNSSTLNNFQTVTPIQSSTGMISALKINTATDKPYYLSYSVQAEGQSGYYGAVNSNNHNTNNYAGVFGNAIQALKIKVYNSSGTATITKGVVVMYRVYTDKWLPWVSNADPEWMQSVKIKYGIVGALDTRSGYAGVAGQKIKAVEIRIFEEDEIITECSSGNKKTVSTPYIYQVDEFPTGCESVSTVMALQKSGVNMTVATFVDRYLDKDPNRYSFNPNTHFGGDPRTTGGMGCYAPVIMNALNKALAGRTQYATNLTGKSLSTLCSDYIDNGIPVIMWATMDMRQAYTVNYSQGLTWIAPEHCLLLVGYDDTCYIFHDPMKGANVHYLKADVAAAYEALGKQSIVVQKGSTASNPPVTENTNPDILPEDNAEEYVKESEPQGSVGADPIDLYSGSHIIENQIISLFGGNKTVFSINYNSSKLVSGSIGAGWYHNFEKHLQIGENIAYVYDSPSVYSVYEKTSDNTYSCTTTSRENYILTLISDGSYELDCNKIGKMYFSNDGKLIGIEDKQGFKTTLSYSENTIVINDAVNGSITLNITNGLVTSVTDGIRTAELNYSGGYLVSIKDVNGERLYYTYNADGQIETGSDDNGTVYFTDYYTDGKITKQVDGSGNNAETNFAYTETESGIVVEVTNRNGDKSISEFNNCGQLVSFTDENGNDTTHTYDNNLNLISTTDANGNTERTIYNSNNLPVRLVDKNGNLTSIIYDSNYNTESITYGNNGDVNCDGIFDVRDLVRLKIYIVENTSDTVIADVNMDGNVNSLDVASVHKYLLGLDSLYLISEKFSYNEHNQLVSHINLEGTVTSYTYDSNKMPSSKTVGDRTEQYIYADGKLTQAVDARGNTTTYSYNSLGLPVSETVGENTTTYSYDNKGNVLTTTDALGNTVSRTYDGNGLVTSETDANGNTTHYSYNGNMKLLYVTFCDGTYIYYGYDGEDRLVSVKDQKGNISYTEYDKAGRVTRKSDAEKNTTEYIYDNVGNVLSTVNSDGGVTEYSYDNNGNVLTQKDILGNITTNTYDRFNRVISTTNAIGGITQYDYSLSGNLLKVTNPLGNVAEYTYDIYGNKLTDTDFNGSVTTYTYDNNNNLLTVTDALGNVTTNFYDVQNRIIETKNADGSSVKYTYDAIGRLLSVTDARGNTASYTYDPNGNVLTVTDALGNVQTTNQYDEFNQVISTTTASGGITANTYDNSGNLLSVTDSLGNKQSYIYDSLNRAVTVKDKAGNKTEVKYNSVGNMLSYSLDGATTNYTYDTNGNLLSETTSSGGLVQYTYNALNLKQVQINARG
ncbi:MAG: C39 family peptidase, partial [Clostridia bacterium]|nr:C39 family peptidase [Clostridia bacterium]